MNAFWNLISAFSDEMNEFVEQNNNLYPPKFLSTEENLDIGKGFSHFFHQISESEAQTQA